jgi:hypothetical protein
LQEIKPISFVGASSKLINPTDNEDIYAYGTIVSCQDSPNNSLVCNPPKCENLIPSNNYIPSNQVA